MFTLKRFFFTISSAAFLAANAASATELDLQATHAFLIDYKTDTVLYNKKGDERMRPSSMSKMMTAYVTFMKLKDGSINLDKEFNVSLKAQKSGGSTMFIRAGQQVKVADLIQGMIVQSGNDACITLAEGISGSEEAFTQLMNDTAARLGMHNSSFRNATGLPDPEHLMTPKDLAILAKALIRDFPEYYAYHQQKEFTFNDITQPNRNTLLGEYGVDGIKTGHTDAAGYGLTATNNLNGRRLIAVVNGLSSHKKRSDEARKLLAYGHANFHNLFFAEHGQNMPVIPVWHGTVDHVPLTLHEDITITVAANEVKQIKTHITYQEPLVAPVLPEQEVGQLILSNDVGEIARFPLYPQQEIVASSLLGRIGYGIGYYKNKLLNLVN